MWLAIATSAASNIFVQNEHPRNFISVLTPHYKPVNRNQVSEQIKLMFLVKECYGLHWHGGQFLGQRINTALCLDKVPYPHDAWMCLDSEYDINSVEDPKIGFITTNNGLNMKKSYSGLKADRQHTESFEFLDDDEEECEVLEINSEKKLICVAHALTNSIKCAINGSIRKKNFSCFATQNMLKNALNIAKKVTKTNL